MAMKTVYEDTLVPLNDLKKGQHFKLESGSEYKVIDLPKVKAYNYDGKPKAGHRYINNLDAMVYLGKRVKDTDNA